MTAYAPSLEEIRKYLEKTGKRGAHTLSILGKLTGYVNAIQTEVGWELLKDDVARHDELFLKIYEEVANEKEKAEFRVLRDRLKISVRRITVYLDKLKEMETAIKSG